MTVTGGPRVVPCPLSQASSLADIFEAMEGCKASLGVEEYGVNQTSLEQIFNTFAVSTRTSTLACMCTTSKPCAYDRYYS